MRKKPSEITRAEWIAIAWIDDTQMGDEERVLVGDFKRTPDEAVRAMEEWDSTAAERKECG